MKSDAFRATIVVILAIVGVWWGITLIPGPSDHHPPLPPHVLVMQHETFLVEPGYGAYGSLICDEGYYKARPGGKAFNGWWILSCVNYAHNFQYPKSKVWSYANLP